MARLLTYFYSSCHWICNFIYVTRLAIGTFLKLDMRLMHDFTRFLNLILFRHILLPFIWHIYSSYSLYVKAMKPVLNFFSIHFMVKAIEPLPYFLHITSWQGPSSLFQISSYSLHGQDHQARSKFTSYSLHGKGHQACSKFTSYSLHGKGHQACSKFPLYHFMVRAIKPVPNIFVFTTWSRPSSPFQICFLFTPW